MNTTLTPKQFPKLHQGISQAAAAMLYAQAGWSIFPCTQNKKPMTKNGFKAATSDLAQVRRWWAEYPDASIGAPTG